MSTEKFCLVQDEDSHWFLIPLRLKNKFENMCAKAYKEDDFDEFCNQFDEYRSNGPHTLIFENPEEVY